MSPSEPQIHYLRRSQGRVFTGVLILMAIAPVIAIAIVAHNISQASTWASLGHSSLSAAFRLWLGGANPDESYPGALVLALEHIDNAVFAAEAVPVTVFLLFRMRQRRRRERELLSVIDRSVL
jgi:hypothetical protein